MKSKAVKFSISLTPEQHAAAQAIATRRFNGELSAYFQYLIDSDPTADLDNIVIELVRCFDPSNVDAFKEALNIWPDTPDGDFSQKNIIQSFLAALKIAIGQGLDPDDGFTLAPVKTGLVTKGEALTILGEIRDLLKAGATLPLAAETEKPAHLPSPKNPPPPEYPTMPAKRPKKPKPGPAGPTPPLSEGGANVA